MPVLSSATSFCTVSISFGRSAVSGPRPIAQRANQTGSRPVSFGTSTVSGTKRIAPRANNPACRELRIVGELRDRNAALSEDRFHDWGLGTLKETQRHDLLEVIEDR
jgi:hypothetical protein